MKTVLKLDFNEAPILIRERNLKSLSLLLLIPWFTSVIGSMLATSQGLILIINSQKVEGSLLRFVFKIAPNDWIYITTVVLCNLIIDLLLIFPLIRLNKFEINKLNVVILLISGHLLAATLYFLSLLNNITDALALSLMQSFFLGSTYYMIMRYLPKKYVEILLPYSLIFIALETQTLIKATDNQVIKNSKRRLGMYTRAMLLAYVGDRSETDLIGLLRKQRALNRANSNEINKVTRDFCNYLNSSFGIHIPISGIVFKKETLFERLLRDFYSASDAFFNLIVFVFGRFSIVLDLEEKSNFPVAQSNPKIPPLNDSKYFKQLIKHHLDRAQVIDAISAKQKLYAIIFSASLALIFPTITFIVGLREDIPSFTYRSILLLIQYLATFFFALTTMTRMMTRYRKAGIDIIVPNKIVGNFTNFVQSLILFSIALSTDRTIYMAVVPLLSQNIMLFLIGNAIIQLGLLFILIKPPVELKRPSFALSLLVRELLLLYSQTLGTQSISARKQIGRHIYFSKKYMNLVAKGLIYPRFDGNIQSTRIQEYFGSINEYLDNLGTQIRLGGEKKRVEGVDQIKVLIVIVALEKFGEIPDAIPEFQKRLEINTIRTQRPSFFSQTIQVLDTSPTVRTILIIMFMLVINLLIPSLWVDLQNISTLFQLMAP